MLRRKITQKRQHNVEDIHETEEEHGAGEQKRKFMYPEFKKANEENRLAHLEEAVLGGADNVVETLLQNKSESIRKQKAKEISEESLKKWEDSDDEEDDKNGVEIDKPSWAGNYQDEESADSDEEALMSHSHNVLSSSNSLPSSTLAFKRVTDANKEDPSSDAIHSVQFHPKATVLLAGGMDNTLRLFAVDGCKNSKIHSAFLEKTPVMGAKFSRGGSEIIIGSKHRSFYIYDLEGNSGFTFRPKVKGLQVSTMSKFEVSPDGRFIAFLGNEGYVHLFSQKSHELVESLKTNGLVISVTFSADGKFLYTFGAEGKVYVFDLKSRDCIHNFIDDGCVSGKSIDVSPDGQYIALGDDCGIVNVYNHDAAMASREPKPIKHIKNLTTSCDQVLFNSKSEILALRTKSSLGGIRLVHLPSLTVFSGFPHPTEFDLKTVLTMDFSPSSGYLALGNVRGKCPLYRLQHYSKY